MHGYIGHRSIIGRTSQRIRDAELQLFPCDLRDGRGFDEDIHLLANVDGEAIGLEAKYDLQDARIHAFRAAAGEGALRHDVGLEADELECRLLGRIAAHCCDGLRAGLDAPGILLVYVHAQVQRHQTSEEQQRLGCNAGGVEFAGAHVAFQDLAIYRRGDATAGDFGFTRFDGRIGLRDACSECPGGEAAAVELIEADDFLPGEGLGAAKLVFEVGRTASDPSARAKRGDGR